MTSDFTNATARPALQKKVKRLLIWLGTEANDEDKAQAYLMIQQATATCGDRVALSVNELSLLMKISRSGNLSLSDLKDLIVGMKRYELLEKIANEKCEQLRAVDPIEVHLCYQVMLKDDLELPLEVDTMLYQGLSGVAETDIDHAREKILQATGESSHLALLIESACWLKALEKQPDFATICKTCSGLKDQAMEEADEDFQHQFAINDATIWNPHYIMTERFLQRHVV